MEILICFVYFVCPWGQFNYIYKTCVALIYYACPYFPTSLNVSSCWACRERGITVTPYFRLQRGGGGVNVNTQCCSYFATQCGIFSPRTHLSAAKYLQRRTSLNPRCGYHLYPAEADVKHSWHTWSWHSRTSELERKWEDGWEKLRVRAEHQHVHEGRWTVRSLLYFKWLQWKCTFQSLLIQMS